MSGKYKELDMEELNITIVRDFATYLALTANDEGIGGDIALQRLSETLGNRSWMEYCSDSMQW